MAKKHSALLMRTYVILVFCFMYLPIAVMIAFSFNESKSRSNFTGFTLGWYKSLFHNEMILSALGLSLVLALCGYGTLLVFCLTGLSHSLAMLCIPGVVVFACNGMLTVLTTLFLSNSVDYGQLKTGRREESVIFSMQTFVVKAASGVAVFLTGIGLDLIGLVGNTEETGPVAVQSAGTLLGLRLMMTVLPMLVLAGALVLFRRKFILTDARAAEISAQLHGEEAHHD